MAKKKPKGRLVKLQKQTTDKVKILGLDCSSNTVGWGLITVSQNKPSLIAHGHLKPLKSTQPLIVRLDDIYNRVGEICEEFEPSFISIEDILLFMKGKSGAKTITTLAVFNRIISLSAYRHSDAELRMYPAQTIRKLIKDSYKNITTRIAKTDLPDIIRAELEPGFENILNKKGDVSEETYDEGDGIATAWGCTLDLIKNGVLK